MISDKYKDLTAKALELGAALAIPIATEQIVSDPRSYLKCRFGCKRWGKYWTCPPHLSISPASFTEAFVKYSKAIIIQTSDPQSGQDIALAIEKEAMLSHDCIFAFAMTLCVQCEECAYPDPCRFPHLARPAMDAYGVDIGKTLEVLGIELKFDKEGKLLPAWYSIVLLD